MAMAAVMSAEADRNYEAFKKLLPGLLQSHAGKFALMNDGNVVEFFDTIADAAKFGGAKFGPNNFSVQEVTSKEINLGFYSYALHKPAA